MCLGFVCVYMFCFLFLRDMLSVVLGLCVRCLLCVRAVEQLCLCAHAFCAICICSYVALCVFLVVVLCFVRVWFYVYVLSLVMRVVCFGLVVHRLCFLCVFV